MMIGRVAIGLFRALRLNNIFRRVHISVFARVPQLCNKVYVKRTENYFSSSPAHKDYRELK